MKTFSNVIIIACLALTACQKKSPITPPDFEVTFNDRPLTTEVYTTIPVARNQPALAPQIFISGTAMANVSKAVITLGCPAMSVSGAAIIRPGSNQPLKITLDDDTFSSRLSLLPKINECRLVAQLFNEKGSSTTKSYLVQIHFDSNPTLEVQGDFIGVGQHPCADNGRFTIESFSLKNTLPYPTGFRYRAIQDIPVFPLATYQARAVSITQITPGAPTFEALKLSEYFLVNTMAVEVSGGAKIIAGRGLNFDFIIPPGETFKIATYGMADPVKANCANFHKIITFDHARHPTLTQWSRYENTSDESDSTNTPVYSRIGSF